MGTTTCEMEAIAYKQIFYLFSKILQSTTVNKVSTNSNGIVQLTTSTDDVLK